MSFPPRLAAPQLLKSLDSGIHHVLGQRLQFFGEPPICCGVGDCPTPGWGSAFLSVLGLADYIVSSASEILWAAAQIALSMGGSYSSFGSQLTVTSSVHPALLLLSREDHTCRPLLSSHHS